MRAQIKYKQAAGNGFCFPIEGYPIASDECKIPVLDSFPQELESMESLGCDNKLILTLENGQDN